MAYIQTFKNIVYEFLWKGKTDPVKPSVLSNDYLEGGLKMTNIDTYIKGFEHCYSSLVPVFYYGFTFINLLFII
jgi:hypothetical protein